MRSLTAEEQKIYHDEIRRPRRLSGNAKQRRVKRRRRARVAAMLINVSVSYLQDMPTINWDTIFPIVRE